jgi:hypothetical protein
VVAQYRALIDQEVAADTRKLTSYEAFQKVTADRAGEPAAAGATRGREMSLRSFAEQRSKYLLNHPEVKKAAQ